MVVDMISDNGVARSLMPVWNSIDKASDTEIWTAKSTRSVRNLNRWMECRDAINDVDDAFEHCAKCQESEPYEQMLVDALRVLYALTASSAWNGFKIRYMPRRRFQRYCMSGASEKLLNAYRVYDKFKKDAMTRVK